MGKKNCSPCGPRVVVSRLDLCTKDKRMYECMCAHASVLSLFVLEAIFVERLEILSVSTKRKKVEVTGGFYSEEDMRNELNYSQRLCLQLN